MTNRTVEVFDNLIGISWEWVGLKTLVKVQRLGTRKGKPYQQTAYYISSLNVQAPVFAQGIRGYWGIENCLHWVKDVVLGGGNETALLFKGGELGGGVKTFQAACLGCLRVR